jgi:hypothetical protein
MPFARSSVDVGPGWVSCDLPAVTGCSTSLRIEQVSLVR